MLEGHCYPCRITLFRHGFAVPPSPEGKAFALINDNLPYHKMLTKKTLSIAQQGLALCNSNYRAALAFSTTAAEAAGSLIAISDRLLRFSSMPAFLMPFMNLE